MGMENPDWSSLGYFSDRFLNGQDKRYGDQSDAIMNRAGYQMDPTQYNGAMAQAQQARQSQQYGLSQLRQLADPTQQSAASNALMLQADQGARMQQGLAGLALGGPAAQVAAQRQAVNAGLYGGQQAAQQASILRANEAAQAAGQYGQVAGQMRAGDMSGQGLAGQYAQADFGNRMRNDEMNAARQRSLEGTRAGYMGLSSETNARREQQNIDEWKANNAVREGNAARVDQLNAAASNAVAAGLSGLGSAAQKWGSDSEAADAQASAQQKASDHRKRDDENYYSDERMKRRVTPMSDAQAAREADKADRLFGRYGVAEAEQAAADVKRATDQPVAEGVQSARERETTLPQEMMRSLGGGYAFNYKPEAGEDPSQRRYGVMAQDLERTPMGASIVRDTPDGKMVDTRMASGVTLAAVSDLQRQIDEMKGVRRGR